MTQARTWTKRQRSVGDCLRVLRSLDEGTLERRAERLAIEVQITTPVRFYLPIRTALLLDEAGACFTNGQYTGCILALATGVEHGLRELLNQPNKLTFHKLIQIGVDTRVVNGAEADVFRALKNYRNQVTHNDINDLAAGTILWLRTANMRISGVEVDSTWEKIIPASQDHKEIASDLAAERKAGELLVKVREVIHEIFDRYSFAAQSLDSQG